MSRIELTEQFYEDEVREGFYIPSCIKQAWGAQIQVLNEIDRVCRELGIKYFAGMGTYIGAVRHGGFVPWDDDLDICMLRDDYNKFLEEGVALLPDGFEVYNLRNREEHTLFLANVVAKNRICFEAEHLEKFHGFPYIVAIDVFIIDYLSNDEKKQQLMQLKAQYVLRISDEIRKLGLGGDELRLKLDKLNKDLGITIPGDLSDNKIRQLLDLKAEELFASFLGEKDKAERIAQLMPLGLDGRAIMPKFYCSRSVDIPFETGTIPVPLIYDDTLRRYYGDYMKIYHASAHGYPFFEKSKEELQEVLDFKLPEYSVDADEIIRRTDERRSNTANLSGNMDESVCVNTYKAVVNECLAEMEKLNGILNEAVLVDDITDVCSELQQLAIDLGTYMEAVKGEGYDIVALLEQYCEALYELTQAGSADSKKESSAKVCRLFEKVTDKVRVRKEVLFLPFKGEYWDVFESEYKNAMEDPDTDVYVVPIPYYYKDYMGRLHDMQYAPEKYPEDVAFTHYDNYDYALHHADIIYIQNPYDDQNIETSVPPFFYSDKLLNCTDRLVYIPWFRTYDFTVKDERDYVNMKYYCTMPGVINADEVILPSETLRNTYIEKLCDFAGIETRSVWESKLTVGYNNIDNNEDDDSDWDEGDKTLLYYPDFSDVLLYGQQAIDKIRNVVKMCKTSRDIWKFVFVKGRLIESVLKEFDKELYDKYMKVVEYAVSEAGFEVISEDESDYETLVKRCSAYYGDGGHLAHLFRNAGKPVKLQDYENRDLDDIGDICECADF